MTIRNTGTLGASPYIWSGSYYTTSRLPVRGMIAPVVGQSACVSGSLSRSSCGMEITGVNRRIQVLKEGPTPGTFLHDYWIKPAITIRVPETLPGAAGGGDSGSPIYRHTVDGGVVALGILSAVGFDELLSDPEPPSCRQIQVECGHMLYAPHLAPILDYYGANLATMAP